MNTQPVTLPRGVWQFLLQCVGRSDQTTMERITGVAISPKDYETNGFLGLRYKLIQGILRGLNEEAMAKLAGDKPEKEAEIEISLTCAELTYLDMVLDIAAFQGASKVKQALWKALDDLLESTRRASFS